MSREIDIRIDKEMKWTLDVLINMINIPTVNPPGKNFYDFAEYTSKVMESIGMSVKVIEVPKDIVEKICRECADSPRYIVIGRIGNDRPVIQFNGHYDVVPAGEGWSFDPFKAFIDGDKVYGRGSVDMKGGIASILLAVKIFTSIYKEFNGSIEIALVPDEEIGGDSGTGYLVSEISKPNYAIIAEGSGSNNIWIGHKGALWGYIEVYGRQSHGSTPWRGINAFEYMSKIVMRFIDEYRPSIEMRKSSYDYGDPKGNIPTINIGGEVRGSTKINIVPGYYAFSFDRRIIPEESIDDVEMELKSFVDRLRRIYPEVKIEMKVVNRLAPAITKPDSTLVKIAIESIENALGIKPKPIVCLGGLDLHYYTEKGIDAISYGPGPEENAHIANEYVLIPEIKNVAKSYVYMLTKLLGVDL